MKIDAKLTPKKLQKKVDRLFALAGQIRDPEVRRGLARALNTFKVVSASETETAANTLKDQETHQSPEGGA